MYPEYFKDEINEKKIFENKNSTSNKENEDIVFTKKERKEMKLQIMECKRKWKQNNEESIFIECIDKLQDTD